MPMLRTDYWPKPVPSAAYDWTAWVDGQEEWGQGYGPSKDAAVDRLIEMLEAKCQCENNGDYCRYCEARLEITGAFTRKGRD